jgi:GDP-mannose 6-dehydrogenase
MNITVFGMGYVGCVTAALFARERNHVVGVDKDPNKIEMLRRGETPVLETGLPELVRRVHLAGRLKATDDAGKSLVTSEVIIVCVGTPSAPDGGVDTTALARVSQDIGKGIREHKGYPVVVIRSTVFPDVIENVVIPRLERASERKLGEGFGLVINPEFLREGTAIADFEAPQYTLIGTDEAQSSQVMQELYAFLDAPFIQTDRRSASIVKYASNCYHGLKVAFANEVATVSRAAGADAQEVMRIFCEDEKLNCSKAYLRPGMPFGGSCLPKDLRAAAQYGRRADLMLPVLNAALTSNRLQTQACSNLILSHGRGRVGVFGMSFKAGTDDLRESPMVSIIETLLGKGLQVSIYDTRVQVAQLIGTNREYVESHIPHIRNLLRNSMEEVIAESDVLVIGNGDEEYRQIPGLMAKQQVLIDLVGVAAPEAPLVTRYSALAG